MLKRSLAILVAIFSVGLGLFLCEQATGRDVLAFFACILLVLIYDPYILDGTRWVIVYTHVTFFIYMLHFLYFKWCTVINFTHNSTNPCDTIIRNHLGRTTWLPHLIILQTAGMKYGLLALFWFSSFLPCLFFSSFFFPFSNYVVVALQVLEVNV